MPPDANGTSPDPGKRPRLWVPGLVYETTQGAVDIGPSAGVAELGAGLGALGSLGSVGLAECRHCVWLVERRGLSAAQIAEHGIVLPETLVDRDAHPLAHEWLSDQPLLAVSGLGWESVAAAANRIVALDFGATELGVVTLRIERGGATATELSLSLEELDGAASDASRARARLDVAADRSPVDRLLRAIAGASFSESAVASALAIRTIVEEGYGYRGARAGSFASLEALEPHFAQLEARIAEVQTRADGQRQLAERLRDAVDAAPPDQTIVEVAAIGLVTRVPVPPARVACAPRRARFVAQGVEQGEIALAPFERWQLPPSDGWQPSALVGEGRRGASSDRRAARSPAAVVVAVAVLLALVVVLAVVLWGGP